jgi:hypothetical protein
MRGGHGRSWSSWELTGEGKEKRKERRGRGRPRGAARGGRPCRGELGPCAAVSSVLCVRGCEWLCSCVSLCFVRLAVRVREKAAGRGRRREEMKRKEKKKKKEKKWKISQT